MATAIVREEGVAGLWRGTGISMVRSGVGAAALLPTNSKLKEVAARDDGVLRVGVCGISQGQGNARMPRVRSPECLPISPNNLS